METNAPKEMGFTLTKGNIMHICIEPEKKPNEFLTNFQMTRTSQCLYRMCFSLHISVNVPINMELSG